MEDAAETIDSKEEIKDPVSGMTTDSPEAYLSYEHRGETFYFCSRHCMEKFKDAPDKYTAGDSEEPAPDPSDQKENQTAGVYTCPMHPEVVQDHPGDCPKCGMALEPKTVEPEAEVNREYLFMRNRFWVCAALALPVMLIAMRDFFGLGGLERTFGTTLLHWAELVLTTPVALWGGRIFFVRAWKVDRDLEPEHVHPDRAGHRRH
jgi:Cu+-exporting ATPase